MLFKTQLELHLQLLFGEAQAELNKFVAQLRPFGWVLQRRKVQLGVAQLLVVDDLLAEVIHQPFGLGRVWRRLWLLFEVGLDSPRNFWVWPAVAIVPICHIGRVWLVAGGGGTDYRLGGLTT